MPDRLYELIGPERIAARVAELGTEISAAYRGTDLLIVGVLKGCFMFLADLLRQMDIPVSIDFLRVASYGAATETSGVVEIRKDLESSVTGRAVLIVEDIIDTGLTVDYLRRHVLTGQPATVQICAFLDKPARRRVNLKPDYVGFAIDDLFVVGYGLDFNEHYRQLAAIHVLEQDANA